MKNGKYKYSKYQLALKIIIDEANRRDSLKPFRLLWKKVYYGQEQPYRIKATLPDYIEFCRINKIPMQIPEEELA